MMQDKEQSCEREEELNQLRSEERGYGWQLMSPAERQTHRRKMRSLKTRKKRQAFRKKHHERMQKRAEEMGIELQEMRK